MNLEDKAKKLDEELTIATIRCQYIAHIHQNLKDEIKYVKELKKENLERMTNKLKEMEKSVLPSS